MDATLIKTIDDQGVFYTLSGKKLPENYVLSVENCQAIERGYDLADLADEELLKAEKHHKLLSPITYRDGVIKGFQIYIEILGDKRFSEEDINRALSLRNEFLKEDKSDGEIIQSLQQTEWEVVIVTEVVPDIDSRPENDGQVFSTNKKIIPKLDEKGNLILKRK